MTTTDIDPVGESNNFSLIFGDCARTRVMYVLFFFHERAVDKTTLAEEAGVSRPTVYEHLEPMLHMGIVEEEDDGRVRVNKENELAKAIASVEWKFIEQLGDIEDDQTVSEYLAALGDVHHQEALNEAEDIE